MGQRMSGEKVFKVQVSREQYEILRTRAVREDISVHHLVDNIVLDGVQRIIDDFRNTAVEAQSAIDEVLKRPGIDPSIRRPIIAPDDISGLET